MHGPLVSACTLGTYTNVSASLVLLPAWLQASSKGFDEQADERRVKRCVNDDDGSMTPG
jgi:hypothetical protein